MPPNIRDHLKNQEEPLVEAIKTLVRIPSVLDEEATDFPFGKGIDDALREALKIAKGLGFQTKYDPDGYFGTAEVGQGDELVGLLGHMDVVPPGNLDAWETGPFEPFEKDGVMYGRGVQDDKGPALASLFAIKALMDAGVIFNKRVRFIFSTDEETLWRGINKYLEKGEEVPTIGFSPDANFPLIYAEKGLLDCTLVGKNESGLTIKCGSAFNAVPDSAIYDGPKQKELAVKLDELGFEYQDLDSGIKVMGKAAHAMIPEEGINAIARLCIALQAIGVESNAINFIAQEIKEDPNASLIFGDVSDEQTGKLKFNIGKIELGEDEVISIDSRIPVTVPKDEIVGKLTEVAERYSLTYNEVDWLAPLYLPLDHPLIESLLRVYREVTDDQVSVPITSGGATLARAIPNCVAYGPNFPETPITEHKPNEYMALEDLFKAMEVYAYAIYELTR
ncbi:MAG: Sapep family Mn(2+)-dependent dipeptidase [Anaerolineales bacterium]|nr:Sapep family Mn(2+)-dependent dipeptidase [Anaerolineales bacterium]